LGMSVTKSSGQQCPAICSWLLGTPIFKKLW
jgi:hypothetical protein